MSDVHSKETRSYNMSMIRGKNTKPELMVRRYLFSKGLRYRVNVKNLPGKPDIVLPRYKTVIFIHGCFWHRHRKCEKAVIPKTNKEFWLNKFEQNKLRDKKVYSMLKKDGWEIIVLWECQLSSRAKDKTLSGLIKKMN